MRLKYFDEFRDNRAIKSLKEISRNTALNECMTDSEKLAIDFDQAKTNYCNNLGKSEEYAASADALCETDTEDKFCLVEFKDGEFECKEIRKKAIDSAYLFSGITDKSVNFVRNNVTFVLVYNGGVKKLGARDKRALAMAKRGKEDFAIWGLEKLRGFYYDKLYVYEKDDWEKSKLLESIVSVR